MDDLDRTPLTLGSWTRKFAKEYGTYYYVRGTGDAREHTWCKPDVFLQYELELEEQGTSRRETTEPVHREPVVLPQQNAFGAVQPIPPASPAVERNCGDQQAALPNRISDVQSRAKSRERARSVSRRAVQGRNGVLQEERVTAANGASSRPTFHRFPSTQRNEVEERVSNAGQVVSSEDLSASDTHSHGSSKQTGIRQLVADVCNGLVSVASLSSGQRSKVLGEMCKSTACVYRCEYPFPIMGPVLSPELLTLPRTKVYSRRLGILEVPEEYLREADVHMYFWALCTGPNQFCQWEFSGPPPCFRSCKTQKERVRSIRAIGLLSNGRALDGKNDRQIQREWLLWSDSLGLLPVTENAARQIQGKNAGFDPLLKHVLFDARMAKRDLTGKARWEVTWMERQDNDVNFKKEVEHVVLVDDFRVERQESTYSTFFSQKLGKNVHIDHRMIRVARPGGHKIQPGKVYVGVCCGQCPDADGLFVEWICLMAATLDDWKLIFQSMPKADQILVNRFEHLVGKSLEFFGTQASDSSHSVVHQQNLEERRVPVQQQNGEEQPSWPSRSQQLDVPVAVEQRQQEEVPNLNRRIQNSDWSVERKFESQTSFSALARTKSPFAKWSQAQTQREETMRSSNNVMAPEMEKQSKTVQERAFIREVPVERLSKLSFERPVPQPQKLMSAGSSSVQEEPVQQLSKLSFERGIPQPQKLMSLRIPKPAAVGNKQVEEDSLKRNGHNIDEITQRGAARDHQVRQNFRPVSVETVQHVSTVKPEPTGLAHLSQHQRWFPRGLPTAGNKKLPSAKDFD